MSEEKSIEQIAEEAKQEEPAKEQSGEELTPEQQFESNQEQIASNGGWKPFEEYVESGGNAADWVPAAIFNVKGEFIGKLKAKDREIDNRLSNVNQVHAAQLEVQRKELTAKRDAAALEGGEENLEIVKNAQHQLDTLNVAPQVQTTSPELEQWNEQNPWVNVPGAKSTYARTLFSGALAQGQSIPQAIALVNVEMAREYPAQQRTKPQASESEKGSKPSGFKRGEKTLSMSDITHAEQKMIDALPGAWKNKSQAEILQAVKDSREA